MSDKIGSRFSGNGDTFGFSYHGDDIVHNLGLESGKYDHIKPTSPGPSITSVIDLRTLPRMPYQKGLVIQDLSPPGVTSKLVENLLLVTSKMMGERTTLLRRWDKFVEVSYWIVILLRIQIIYIKCVVLEQTKMLYFSTFS